MMTATNSSTPATPSTSALSNTSTISPVRQWASLVRAEFTLLRRNLVQAAYAVVLPLAVPFLFLPIANEPFFQGSMGMVLSLILVTGLIFVSYYTPLSAAVNRREDQVLTRLRAGEVGDLSILNALAVPGSALGILMTIGMLAISAPALGMPMPKNIALLALTLVATIILFILGGLATTIVTRTAESAQISSMPFLLALMIGPLANALDGVLPDAAVRILELIPTAATAELVSVAWFGDDGGIAQPLIVLGAWVVILALIIKSKFRWSRRA